MPAQVVARFADAVGRHDAAFVETTPQKFPAVLSEVVEAPAVGAPLPEPLGYDETPVESDPSVAAVESAATGVTHCPLAIADYGSVVVRSTPGGEEPVSLFPEHHVAVVRESDLVADMATAIGAIGDAIRDGHGENVVATGPSATADMGELVVGVHGPKRVTVLFVREDGTDGDGATADEGGDR